MKIQFEHIAIAVHGDDIAAWDRLLRGSLGGEAGMGGDAPGLGFRGGQVLFPDGGMLELISWQEPADEKNPVKRYVERYGPRAALHHLTFLVDDFDEAHELCEEADFEVMLGRYTEHWKELYLRAPFLGPDKMLIQLLETDKDAFKNDSGWDYDWDAFDRSIEAAAPPVKIVGVELATSDAAQAHRVFCELLGAQVDDSGTIRWPDSSMTITLVDGGDVGDSHIVIDAAKSVTGSLEAESSPAGHLIRNRTL
jgi:catechol 2,3-dioxygenase-like lactoylglutathione lyase family enzyme